MSDRVLITPFVLDERCEELDSLLETGWRLNNPGLPAGDRRGRLPALHHPIAEFVARTIAGGDRPIAIAGDCCAAIGVVAGLQRAGLDPVLVWLDAHGDFNTWETTPSGFLGGMPLAMLVGRGEQTLVNAMEAQPVPEVRVILTDGRDLDPGEREALASSGVHHIGDACALLDHPLMARTMYVHFDTDIVNPLDAPAMSYRAEGGPSADELRSTFRSLSRTGRVVAVSMTTWTPRLDTDGRSREVCMGLLSSLVGGK